eukprot:1037912-Amphidinium_carterae.1
MQLASQVFVCRGPVSRFQSSFTLLGCNALRCLSVCKTEFPVVDCAPLLTDTSAAFASRIGVTQVTCSVSI